jgi:hydroxyacylglutathione hydrolase
VIDPRRDVDAYLEWVSARGLKVTAILETHVHADFVSGARDLAAATGAPIYASRLGDQAFPHHELDDNDQIAVGRFRLQALWTPGHTPEHMSYLLVEPGQGNRPLALFSGDLLFAGEVGRPDLLGAEHTRTLAGHLFDTFAHRLTPLPDDVIVYPGHTAGSSCGKKIGDAPFTTLGQERRFNYALQPAVLDSRERFIDTILAGMPTPPTYYPTMKRVNKAGPALLGDLPAGAPLAPDDVQRRIAAGALVVDARTTDAYARAHIAGSFFGGADPDFVNWIGWLAPYDRDLIVVLDDDGRYPAVLTELRRIGLDTVAGYLEGGIAAWEASGQPTVSIPAISVETLQARLGHPDGPVVLDVRTAEEWKSGHIAGAAHRFVGEIAKDGQVPVNGAREIAVTCATGYRSTVAVSLLEAQGRRNLISVAGGVDAWRAAHLPMGGA